MAPYVALLGVILTLTGCAAHYYQAPRPVSYQGAYGSDIPPSFYDYDPNLRQWYTAPYWNPEASP
ncbi:MAG: hypothetical protein ABIG94_02580 [Pseudomonadota bacterium]